MHGRPSSPPRWTGELVLTRSTADTAVLTRGLLDRDGAPLSLRAQAEAGTFEGYACVWDVVDSYGTTFARGCFGAGGLDTLDYALLWMHDPTQPVGVFRAREDDHGLLIGGGWDKSSRGEDARQAALSGSAPGLSVGFTPLMLDPDDPNRFTQARLVETSQITARMASVPGAGITSARGQIPPAERNDDPAVAAALLALATVTGR